MSLKQRAHNRNNDQIRDVYIKSNVSLYADGSVLISLGNTKVLCTVSLVNQVPPFLKHKKQWWLTASYVLLPTATSTRTEREIIKKNDRSVEISRLIGRSLRSVVNLDDKTDEKTIHIDCDVIQADGGTRSACITGASLALKIAERKWLQNNIIKEPVMREEIAAISLGILDNEILVDLDCAEDNAVIADFNYVMTRQGTLVEMQGSAEKKPISWQQIEKMYQAAHNGIQQIFIMIDSFDDNFSTMAHGKQDRNITSWI